MLTHQSRRIRSFVECEALLDRDACVVTLFSGGLDSTYLLLRLSQMGFRNVHALSVDLGEGEAQKSSERSAALLGAHFHLLNAKEQFATDYVAAAIRAHAVYLDTHPVSSTLSRPLIAQLAADLAQSLGAEAFLHTANRSQNTLRRLNGAFSQLGVTAMYGSPYELEPVSRADKLKKLREVGITFTEHREVSGDSNLWCREFESGVLDDPENHSAPASMYQWTRQDSTRNEDPIRVTFARGLPVALDDHPMSLVSLIGDLNVSAGRFGVGRYTGLEHLEGGRKVFEVREMPAAWLLLASSRHLEGACLSAEQLRVKFSIEQVWVREAVEGRWFGPLKKASEAFLRVCTDQVSGTVTWTATDGVLGTSGISAADPLYIRDREAWEEEQVNDELAAYRHLTSSHLPTPIH